MVHRSGVQAHLSLKNYFKELYCREMKSKSRPDRARERIALEAAKIMHEQNLRDYQLAKQKAKLP